MKSRLTFVIACSIIAAGAIQAQTEAERKQVELELKLRAPVTLRCKGTSIDLEMEMKNVSRKTIRLDKYDLWKEYYYSKSYSDGSGRSGGQSSECPECRGDFIILYPGDTFWTSHKFSLDGDFFQDPAKYRIVVSINSTFSNEVNFELIDCGKN